MSKETCQQKNGLRGKRFHHVNVTSAVGMLFLRTPLYMEFLVDIKLSDSAEKIEMILFSEQETVKMVLNLSRRL